MTGLLVPPPPEISTLSKVAVTPLSIWSTVPNVGTI